MDATQGGSKLLLAQAIAQRAMRMCAGYFCGYTFKVQKVGRKFCQLVANTLNYLEDSLCAENLGQKCHRMTHRLFTDHQHRCIRRTAPEEWNLAEGMSHHDATRAEFVRTHPSVDFPGTDLLNRFDKETAGDRRNCTKPIPVFKEPSEEAEVWVKHFTDLYGYRGENAWNPGVFLLSQWESLMHWEVRKLGPPSETNPWSKWVDEMDHEQGFEPVLAMESRTLLV